MDIHCVDSNPEQQDEPSVDIDLEFVRKLASIQCTEDEVATALHVRLPDIYASTETGRRFKEAYANGVNAGKLLLRQQQYKLIMKGDPRMIVFLSRALFDLPPGEENWNIEPPPSPATIIEQATPDTPKAKKAGRAKKD